jgi:hypothetical protein
MVPFKPSWHLFLLPFGLLAGGWCLASLWFPFGWDQGIGATVGDVILSGGLPYRDAFDMKGPLVYYTFAAGQGLFGRHMWAIRVLEVGAMVAFAPALYGAVARLASPRAASWCGIVLVFCVASMTWFHMSQPDTWAALLTLGALGPLVGRNEVSTARLFAGGCLVGLAALIKPFFGAFGLVLLWKAFDPAGARSGQVRRLALLLAGCALPVLGAIGFFAWKGVLDDAYASLVLFNLEAYAGVQHLDPVRGIEKVIGWLFYGTQRVGIQGLAALPAVALGAYGLWVERRSDAIIVCMWLGIALACVVLQDKYYVYHWAVAFVPCAILGSFGIHWLANAGGSSASGRAARAMAAFTAGVFLLGAAPVPARDVVSWGKLILGRDDREAYLRRFERLRYNAADVEAAASYIREHTEEGEPVAIFGYPATVNFLAGRKSPSRFVYAMPLLLERSPRRLEFRAEYLEDLARRPPAYLVHGIHDWDPEDALADFPELGRLLASDYALEARVGKLELYRRKVD